MIIKREKAEIDEQVGEACDHMDESKFPGMSFEEGVIAALDWVLGNEEEPPMSDK